ncbi:sulfur carrier protein ThiS [Cryobacterium sp. TMT1-3]|uniref:Sulfur carrier protein ThiS n=1 Tax=Cryobacterium luteum TaxID=1424661 RepID=A0A5F0D3J6_9MICO|nr:sulfur carrier protein ThiS [Cryobacterium luteum]TFC24802.1 sulfur carrier protein ThiS [Cryobacterium sp. TMT1-3]
MTVNGQSRTVRAGGSVTDLVAQITDRPIDAEGRADDGGRLGVAVARNAAVVPRSQWSCTRFAAGDEVEIVSAVQGG